MTVVFADQPVTGIREAAAISGAAVSAVNGKLDVFYGRVRDGYSRGISGSLACPVGTGFGAQLDLLFAHANQADFYGIGGHFFTRLPEQGLLGVVVSGLDGGTIESGLGAVEGEYYLDDVTVGAVIGYNHVRTDLLFPAFIPSLRTQDDSVYAQLYAAVYPADDLMIRFDYRSFVERKFYGLLIEYQLPKRGWSLYADLSVGDRRYRHVMGGVRYYFGGRKSLKDRHRQDDPPNVLTGQQSGSLAAVGEPPPADESRGISVIAGPGGPILTKP